MVKPAAFARVLGKVENIGAQAQIKIRVRMLLSGYLFKFLNCHIYLNIGWDSSLHFSVSFLLGQLYCRSNGLNRRILLLSRPLLLWTACRWRTSRKIFYNFVQIFTFLFRIKAEMTSDVGQNLTFGPVELRIGVKTQH